MGHLYRVSKCHYYNCIGVPNEAVYEKVTNTFVMERASVSTLSFAIDDPAQGGGKSKQGTLDYLIVDMYSGGRTASQKGATVSLVPRLLPPSAQ